jgi:DNA-binding response OmpR family regulator
VENNREKVIMVVDYEVDTALLLKLYLESAGYRVDSYTDPVKALSSFKPRHYDLNILDVSMPRMNGFQLYRQMNQIDDSCKVCFITEFEAYFQSLKEFFHKLDVACFIQKPVTREKLLDRIAQELGFEDHRL